MKLFFPLTPDDLTVRQLGPANPREAIGERLARKKAPRTLHRLESSGQDNHASESWDGVERRSGEDQRQHNRRDEQHATPLDTRSGHDRRHEGRRSIDPNPPGHFDFKA